jgi:hypothetical protein
MPPSIDSVMFASAHTASFHPASEANILAAGISTRLSPNQQLGVDRGDLRGDRVGPPRRVQLTGHRIDPIRWQIDHPRPTGTARDTQIRLRAVQLAVGAVAPGFPAPPVLPDRSAPQ